MPSEDLTLSRAALPLIAALVGSFGVGTAPAAETFTLDARGDSPQDRTIRRGLKPDRAPPLEWAISAAETARPPLAPGLQGVDSADPRARLVALSECLAAGYPNAVAGCCEDRSGGDRGNDALSGRGAGG